MSERGREGVRDRGRGQRWREEGREGGKESVSLFQ